MRPPRRPARRRRRRRRDRRRGGRAVKFFVPYAADDDHAEQIWSDARADLFDLGLPTTKRRIWALSIHSSGGRHLLNIGRRFDPDEGPTLIIFEASNRKAYYVC